MQEGGFDCGSSKRVSTLRSDSTCCQTSDDFFIHTRQAALNGLRSNHSLNNACQTVSSIQPDYRLPYYPLYLCSIHSTSSIHALLTHLKDFIDLLIMPRPGVSIRDKPVSMATASSSLFNIWETTVANVVPSDIPRFSKNYFTPEPWPLQRWPLVL